MPIQDECKRQVQRVLHSAGFRNASMLQQLLQYLFIKVFDHGSETLKEYTIGVEAFGRPHDFDPKTDTIVRVQIHRLRQKLKEYYDSDGIGDPILIEIPKGHYLPVFESVDGADSRVALDLPSTKNAPSSAEPTLDKNDIQADQHPQNFRTRFVVFAGIAAVGAMVVFAVGLWVGSAKFRIDTSNQTAAASSQFGFEKSSDPVKAFWARFLGNDPTPVIAYPDAVFLLDEYNDLFRFRSGATDFRGAPVDPHIALQFASNPALVARAGQLYYENSYLGFGELKGVGMLSNLFGQMGLKPTVKPSRELTVDDLKQHNVIMLGSSSQNIAVAHFSNMGDFSFSGPSSRLEEWRGMIVNARPGSNEASIYRVERDPVTRVLKTDYSLITIQPGVVPGRYIADLGGMDTTGSEGAVLFATSRQGIEDLSRALENLGGPSAANAFPTFQALLRVRLEKGYDVIGASLVTVHKLPPTQGETTGNPKAPTQPK